MPTVIEVIVIVGTVLLCVAIAAGVMGSEGTDMDDWYR